MENLKLTTKSEILSYLENEKITLKKKENRYTVLGFGSWCVSAYTSSIGANMMGLPIGFQATNELLGFSLLGFAAGIGMCSVLCFEKWKNCNYKLQKTEKNMEWINKGTFMENSLAELEEKVISKRRK